MPLIECPECKQAVSSEAHACPRCGYPVAEKLKAEALSAAPDASSTVSTQLLAEVHPSCWGYFWYWFFFWLIVPPVIAVFRRASTVLRVYPDRLNIERGIFSKCYQDYRPRDIRSIDIDQGLLQRMVNIGDITISTSATVEGAEVLKSIPDPKGLRDLILAQRGSQ